jgi:hypothetical protein
VVLLVLLVDGDTSAKRRKKTKQSRMTDRKKTEGSKKEGKHWVSII